MEKEDFDELNDSLEKPRMLTYGLTKRPGEEIDQI